MAAPRLKKSRKDVRLEGKNDVFRQWSFFFIFQTGKDCLLASLSCDGALGEEVTKLHPCQVCAQTLNTQVS